MSIALGDSYECSRNGARLSWVLFFYRVSLQAFAKFKDTKDALADTTALIESKIGKGLKKFLKKNVVNLGLDEKLAVADRTLGSAIKKKFSIDVIFTDNTHEVIRGIREQLTELVTGLSEKGDPQLIALEIMCCFQFGDYYIYSRRWIY